MVSKQLRRVSRANSFTVNQSFSVNVVGGSLRESPTMKYVIAAFSILVLVFVSGSVALVGGAVSVPANLQPK